MTDQNLQKTDPIRSCGALSAPAPQFDGRAFRDALGTFASGVTVVTSGLDVDRCTGTTVSAFSALSLDPALVLVCLKNDSNILPMIRETGSFAIHVMVEDQKEAVMACAGKDPDKMRGISLELTGCAIPALTDYLTRFECVLHDELDGGDHRIVVGRVVDFACSDAGRPMTFYKGGLNALTPVSSPG